MKISKLFPLVVIIFLLVTGFWLAKKNPNGMEIKQSVQITVPEMVQEKSDTEYLSFDIYIPQSAETKYPELFSSVQKSRADFMNDFGSVTEEEAKEMHLGGDRKYNLTIATKVATSTKSISFIVETYTFTGGAHGMTLVSTFTYDTSGKLISLDKIFSSPYLEKISTLARTYFYNKFGDELDKESIDAGTKPLSENFSSWYLTDENVTFIFGQYAIGPYVLGMQEFPLDKKSVSDIISSEFK